MVQVLLTLVKMNPMKTTLKLFLLLLLPLGSFAQKITEPVDYNDKIVGYQNNIGYKMVAMNDYIATDDSNQERAHALRLELLQTTKESIAGVQKMTSFQGNDELRKSAIELFKFYERVIQTEYKEMIDILYSEDLSEDDVVTLEEMVNRITIEEGSYDDKFQQAQEAFAAKHNLELEENELQEEIDDEY